LCQLPPEEDFRSHDITEQGSPVASLPQPMDDAIVPYPENSLAGVGSHAEESRPMPEVTRPCDMNHTVFSNQL